MFINLKYHIASIVSVFIALGLGMLIGSAFPEDVALVAQQHQMASRLESSIDNLKAKNEALQARLNSMELENSFNIKFEKEIVPTLVKDKLNGHVLAVIVASGHDCPSGLINTLKQAGSDIQIVSTIKYKENIDSLLAEKYNFKKVDKKIFWSSMVGEIAKAIVTGNTELTETLEKEDVLKTEGQYGSRITDLIIITGNNDKQYAAAGEIDPQLIGYLKGTGINMLAAEESSVLYSCMGHYFKMGLTTVDNIDTVAGQVAVAYALDGKPGRYGIKSSAQKLLP